MSLSTIAYLLLGGIPGDGANISGDKPDKVKYWSPAKYRQDKDGKIYPVDGEV